MTGTARGHLYRIAFGKQSAEGTAQATPAYEYNLYDGSLEPTNVEVAHEATDATDTPIGYYMQSAQSVGDPTINTDAASIGLPWKLHLGSEGVTGSTNYVHTFTKNDTKLFGTGYFKRPDVPGGTDRWERMIDGFIRGIETTATKGEPLKTKLDIIGKNHRFPVAAPTPTSTAAMLGASTSATLGMIGATLSLDLDATPATTQVRNIETFVVNSAYANANWIQTDELIPRYLDLGPYSLGLSATMVFTDFNSYNATFFGDASVTTDTDLSPVVTLGAAKLRAALIPTVSANSYLEFQMPAMRFTVTPWKPDISGAAIRVSITGKLVKPASGEPFSVVVGNQVSAAY